MAIEQLTLPTWDTLTDDQARAAVREITARVPRESHEGTEDPHYLVASSVAAQGFRLPTSDEWEHAVSGGTRSIFRWGDFWPVDTDVWDGGPFASHLEPNAFGLRFSKDPYQSELVDDPEELRSGDGGCMVCGRIGPMSWTTFASAFRYRLKLEDARDTWFEQAHPRRALSIFPSASDGVIRRYVQPTVLDSAEFAAYKLREPLSEHEELVTQGEAREELAEELPDLDAVRAAHPDHDDVQILLSHAYRKLGRFDDAEAPIGSVLECRRDARGLVTLAAVHQARGDIDAAVARFDEAAALAGEPSTDAAHLLREAGRFAEANERYERIHTLHPDVGWARIYALYTRFRAHRDRAAGVELEAISTGPAKGVDWIAALARRGPNVACEEEGGEDAREEEGDAPEESGREEEALSASRARGPRRGSSRRARRRGPRRARPRATASARPPWRAARSGRPRAA